MDVDAVSLATFDFDRNGMILLWSPYANLSNFDNLTASMRLPFPSGEKVNLVNDSDATWANDFLNKYTRLFTITPVYSYKNGEITESEDEIHIDIDVNTVEDLNLLSQLLQEKTLLIPNFANSEWVRQKLQNVGNFGSSLSSKQLMKFWLTVASTIDKHNLYLDNISDYNMSKIVNNYVMNNMYNIITNPVNLIEAQTSVDGTTGPLKTKANNNVQEAILAKSRTPGNFINKAESINENQVGKEGISVCATGLKTFFALSQYYNTILNTTDSNTDKGLRELARCFLGNSEHLVTDENGYDTRGVKILGKVYSLLANIHPKHTMNVRNDILDILVRKGVDYDQALTLSALLSLATDNAKELALAKLNAGTKTIGMYIYGIAIGMDFNELADILMSPVGRIISSKLDGNVFSGIRGFNNVDELVFKYYDEYPGTILRGRSIGMLPGGVKIRSTYDVLSSAFENAYKDVFVDKGKYIGLDSALVKLSKDNTQSLQEKLDMLEALRNQYTDPNIKDTTQLMLANEYYNAYIDEVENYIRESHSIWNSWTTVSGHDKKIGGYKIFNAILELSQGATEMKRLGRILSLNLGIKTKSEEFITQLNYFERAIYDITGKEEDIVDVVRFVRDKDNAYRTSVINKYEKVKHSFNIYDVVLRVPHFNGYLKALATAKQENMEGYAFRSVVANSRLLAEKLNANEKDVIKGLYNYISDNMIELFLRRLKFEIPAGNSVIAKNGNVVTLLQDTSVSLGTEWGRHAFVKWFEAEVIPNLKAGTIEPGKSIISVSENEFIRDLSFDLRTNTVSHNPELVLTLPINMLPRTDIERSILDKYKSEFNKLAGLEYKWTTYSYKNGKVTPIHNSKPLTEMFTMYAMIAHNWKLSENSLVPILSDFLNEGMIKKFHDQVSDKDAGGTTLHLDMSQSIPENLLLYVVPIGSPYNAYSQYTIARNRDSRRYGLMTRARKLSNAERETMEEEEIEAYERGIIGGYRFIYNGSYLNYFKTGSIDEPVDGLQFKLDSGLDILISYYRGSTQFESIVINAVDAEGKPVTTTLHSLEFINDNGEKIIVDKMPFTKLDGQNIPDGLQMEALIDHMLNPC